VFLNPLENLAKPQFIMVNDDAYCTAFPCIVQNGKVSGSCLDCFPHLAQFCWALFFSNQSKNPSEANDLILDFIGRFI